MDVMHRASHVDTSKVSFLVRVEEVSFSQFRLSFQRHRHLKRLLLLYIMKISAIALLSIIGVVAAGKPQLSVS
jgi:hypothetical protein